MAEQLSDLGYLALKEEATAGTPVIPTVFVPLYSEDLVTNVNLDEDTPIVGNKAARWQTIKGQRHHTGSLTVMAEPDSVGYFFSMLLKRGTITGGADPYTWPFTAENPVSSYTIEILKGRSAFRYWGVKASSITPDFVDNKMQLTVNVAALGSFTAREVSTVTGVGPYTITFKTDYDSNPTKGLVVADVMQGHDIVAGTYTNFAVASVVNSTQITTVTDVSGLSDGDLVYLRGLTPSLSLKPPFEWARSEFRFADTAANALSATQTQVEDGSGWTVTHNLNNDEGEKRSGAYDPASIVHTRVDADLNITKYFDNLDDYNRFLTNGKRACVIRHFSGDDHELRITLNNIKQMTSNPPLESGGVIYNEIAFKPQYDTTDGAFLSVSVLNSKSAI